MQYYCNDGRTLMPLSITCHHAATDGYHISRFLEDLQNEMNSFEKYIPA
ncbi:MAG: CatA-like O-acetyltransferase [Oscillospiraceae bacterium]